MGDAGLLIQRLGIADRPKEVEAKAMEYIRMATAKMGRGGLGAVRFWCWRPMLVPERPAIARVRSLTALVCTVQAEVCKTAACVDLACMK
jgi:hypothetical protein